VWLCLLHSTSAVATFTKLYEHTIKIKRRRLDTPPPDLTFTFFLVLCARTSPPYLAEALHRVASEAAGGQIITTDPNDSYLLTFKRPLLKEGPLGFSRCFYLWLTSLIDQTLASLSHRRHCAGTTGDGTQGACAAA